MAGNGWKSGIANYTLPAEISDKLLAGILEVDAEMTITMHVQTVDQAKAVITVKAKISDIYPHENGRAAKRKSLLL